MANMNTNFKTVGEQFVGAYYQMYDSNRASLVPLYNDSSLMTFEGDEVMGGQAIVQKLAGLPFQSVRHQVVKADYHPSPGTQNVLIFITGNLFVDNSPNPLKFAEVFNLGAVPGGGNFFIQNQMFRLNIG
eukprot:TRINITY_DN56666_c0_g1_i1.p1 TRINITY_DN56666_c0_g1~~TRINITY_DN56666_c0_g1_i1.p1  ORF type:complete len:149 (+),score=17.51 TRINITY_DN56666_c0_g1_i1:60-449(+)